MGQFLLDLLSIQMKRAYLSTLRLLSSEQRRYLVQKLDWLIPQEDIRERNDMLTYLTDSLPAATASTAKEQLVELFSEPGSKKRCKGE